MPLLWPCHKSPPILARARQSRSVVRLFLCDASSRGNDRQNADGEQGGILFAITAVPWRGWERKRCLYGVRSAVTRRASFTSDLEPALRRQDASKFGHACCEQSLPTVRMSRRSPLASACGTLAST